MQRYNNIQRMQPPQEYADCNGYIDPPGNCKILSEMFCVTKGKCKFYKAKEKEDERK